MKSDALEFLNQGDWDLLLEKAQQVTFGKGDTILEGGAFRRAIFIIDNGLVRVEQSREGKGIALAQLGSGDIFGEMAFLEGRSASASIIAEDQVAAYLIEETY